MVETLKNIALKLKLKGIYTQLRDPILRFRGYRLLSIGQTNAFMTPHRVKAIRGSDFTLPHVADSANTNKAVFAAKAGSTDHVYVWEYQAPKGENISLSKYGSVVVRQKVLCTDWNHGSFYRDIWKRDRRIEKTAPAVIALFSQYQDGVFYGGYYDFVFLVATKLCRIKESFGEEYLADSLISYHLFNTTYETEYLQLLDIDTARLADSYKYKVISPRVLTGNSAHWHPNPADIVCLKKWIEKKFKPVKTASDRIYISRADRRRISNEDELVIMLKKFNFVIIEDKKRSVTEQITIYHNASFVLGPHGASFSNIIWCTPGTHLFELFSPNYTPDFFLYLANVMDLKYSAFYEGVPNSNINYFDGLVEDIYIPVAKLEACLEDIFNRDSAVEPADVNYAGEYNKV